jgi:hypothetical protein
MNSLDDLRMSGRFGHGTDGAQRAQGSGRSCDWTESSFAMRRLCHMGSFKRTDCSGGVADGPRDGRSRRASAQKHNSKMRRRSTLCEFSLCALASG